MAIPYIKEIENAKRLYGVRHFKYPVDVATYEDKVNVPHEARSTCGYCKKFAEPQHITDHHNNRTNVMSLFDEDKS
jgi:hypothetical protein